MNKRESNESRVVYRIKIIASGPVSRSHYKSSCEGEDISVRATGTSG